MKRPALSLSVSLALAGSAAPALAHTGHGGTTDLVAGLLHPVFAADHLLAMAAVGLWSGFVLPARLWAAALAFLVAMALGAGLAWAGVAVAGVEGAVLLSVVVFGLMVLLSRPDQTRGRTGLSLAAIAAFGAAHGYAHAAEATGAVWPYLAGFLSATAILHLAGLGLARLVQAGPSAGSLQRALGSTIAAGGLMMAAAG
jgi:urease accessory protein